MRVKREDIEPVEMVYCPSMRTYVPLRFCLNGGPMNARGKCCEYLIEIKEYPATESGPARSIIHAIPNEQPVEKHIGMKNPGVAQIHEEEQCFIRDSSAGGGKDGI